METIFDFNPTSQEIKKLTGENSNRESYCRFIDEDSANNDIAYLLWLRGNEVAARLYVSKLPVLWQHDFWRTVKHP